MVKADLRKAETDDGWRERVGKAVMAARRLSGLSLKEFAAEVKKD